MAAPSSSSPKKFTLRTSDGEIFQVEEAVILQSQTIKLMMEDDCTIKVIPLPNVTSQTLAKIIVYLKKHIESSATVDGNSDSKSVVDNLKSWDADFMKVDLDTHFDLIMAANYLNIASLLELTCQTAADMMKGKTVEEIRKTFNIKNDFTPEEEEKIQRENQWAW